ncbi:hypothetical protein Acor_05160 [Acrocarpospora corrugata]|uniref:Uncharacterized protein n=1 Tax=Acrocarpospora corrugata TaxID=35763 RepID=A0A5M3VNU2_9ACTN|nr:hypothetical protein [Acrocarpospora corrugata]GER98454.1 hypothetical protein Acor_05160 [Acrocarpospora corrugata]
MTAVILGLVAVVLLVLVVVALGMRSMNRRESALSSERIKAMAEGTGPKSRRPAEETFFESFPEGFDAFEEPAKRAAGKQPGAAPRPAPRPGGRQAARPGQRGGKPPAKPGSKQPAPAATAPRGKRGVDEWGADDDYDDDYWSRVRADDGAFGGTIKQRMATPRPLEAEQPFLTADPNASTVQAPLPQRPAGGVAPGIAAAGLPAQPPSFGTPASSPGLADLVEPLRVTPSSAIAEEKTMTFSAPTPDPLNSYTGSPTGPLAMPEPMRSTGPFEPTPATGPFLSGPTTGSFESARVAAYEPPRTSGSFDTVGPGTGSFPATGMFEVPRGAFEAPRAPSGSFPTVEPAYQEPSAWSQPAYPPTPPPTPPAAPQPPQASWPVVRDVLDDPEPPRRDDSWSTSGNYQLPAPTYDAGYGGGYQQEPPPASYSSYEVSAGWATIDDSDSVTGPNQAPPVSPYDSVSYDTPSGQDRRYDYDATQNPAAGWPSYEEPYGTESTTQTGSRRGNHRGPEPDYPDYYR